MKCPIVTHDIKLNLKNRDWAFKNVGYGPVNPDIEDKVFWAKRADEWATTTDIAKQSRCGNCSAFIQTPEMMDCIVSGIQGEESNDETYANEVVASAELGYCELFEFKCAADRTCSAWLVGGPIKKPLTTAQKKMLMMAKFQNGNKENDTEETYTDTD
jgi:hypothetical protein